jgi:hypothetical protein
MIQDDGYAPKEENPLYGPPALTMVRIHTSSATARTLQLSVKFCIWQEHSLCGRCSGAIRRQRRGVDNLPARVVEAHHTYLSARRNHAFAVQCHHSGFPLNNTTYCNVVTCSNLSCVWLLFQLRVGGYLNLAFGSPNWLFIYFSSGIYGNMLRYVINSHYRPYTPNT